MTAIVGIQKSGRVWLGGDSAATSGDLSQRVIGDSKVFIVGDIAFGVCGLPKVMDVLRDAIKYPRQTGNDSRSFMTNELIPAIKNALKHHGCVQNDEFHGSALIGYRGLLYCLEGNFQIITNAYGFDAVGSGADIAIGSLHATRSTRNPHKRILMALEAASINNAGVRPPFNVITLK